MEVYDKKGKKVQGKEMKKGYIVFANYQFYKNNPKRRSTLGYRLENRNKGLYGSRWTPDKTLGLVSGASPWVFKTRPSARNAVKRAKKENEYLSDFEIVLVNRDD